VVGGVAHDLVIVAMAADALHVCHPGMVGDDEVLELNRALGKLFLGSCLAVVIPEN
jgi:hypothetical protein